MSVNTKINGELVKSAGLYKVSAPIGLADIYSTEEKEVGLWIDNKPLYQKTLVTASDVTVTTSGSWVSSGLSVPNGANAIKGELVNQYLVGIIGVFVSPSTGEISFSNIPKTGNITIPAGTEFTITYTKTGDTPWSGFVPQGYGYVSSGDIYSEQERQIGVYIDGKPLYQKTVSIGSLPNNTSKEVSHNISNLDTIVEMVGHADNGQLESSFVMFPLSYPSATANYTVTLSALGKTKIRVTTSTDRSDYSGYVTMRYTKTTDVAGSGEYVPSGDKAVHYSEDEQVIGTWIDGSTLYRRTITGLSIQLNGTTWVNYNPNIPIDKLVNVHAYYVPSGGLMTCAIAEYQYNSSVGIQLTASQGYNRTVNMLIIEYTKTSS